MWLVITEDDRLLFKTGDRLLAMEMVVYFLDKGEDAYVVPEEEFPELARREAEYPWQS